MELKRIEKGIKGSHINAYTLFYENKNNEIKEYEMVSRRDDIKSLEDLQSKSVDAVVILAINRTKDKILLEKEFRLPVGDFIYNFPAGMIEDGECAFEAAKRELFEETGLIMTKCISMLEPAYGLAAITNELTKFIICIADGELGGKPDVNEEIEANWYSKEEALKLLKTKMFATRTQLFCWLWANDKLDLNNF